jgi:hypothetical protein
MRSLCVLVPLLLLTACASKDLLADLPDAAIGRCPGDGYPIFLNRDPVTIEPGPSDSVANTSTLVSEPVTTLGSQLSEAGWDASVACARELFAPFPVVITEVDPGNVEHLEIVVTHAPNELGFPGGVISVAPYSCGDPQRRAITFAFSGEVNSPRLLCEQGFGFTAGIVAGLHHSFRCEDTLSQLAGCGDKSFLDEEVPCGIYSPEPCACGGDTQNTYQTMQAFYGGLCD